MKKFEVLIGSEIAREVNANEYSVAPKTNGFSSACGKDCWTTSGKGKSAVNNHYVYFRYETVLYYFRASAEEVKAVREHFEIAAKSGAKAPVEVPAAVDAPPVEAPKAKRVRAKA